MAFTEKSTQTNCKIMWNHHCLILVWHFPLGGQLCPHFWVHWRTLFELNGHALYWIWARKWHRSSNFKQKSTSHFGGNLYAYFWNDATYCLTCILPRTRVRLSGKNPRNPKAKKLSFENNNFYFFFSCASTCLAFRFPELFVLNKTSILSPRLQDHFSNKMFQNWNVEPYQILNILY